MTTSVPGGEIYLHLWEEIVGFFWGLDTNKDAVNIKIHNKSVKVQLGHINTFDISDKLKNIQIGEKIGIFRCDNPKDPIRVRKV